MARHARSHAANPALETVKHRHALHQRAQTGTAAPGHAGPSVGEVLLERNRCAALTGMFANANWTFCASLQLRGRVLRPSRRLRHTRLADAALRKHHDFAAAFSPGLKLIKPGLAAGRNEGRAAQAVVVVACEGVPLPALPLTAEVPVLSHQHRLAALLESLGEPCVRAVAVPDHQSIGVEVCCAGHVPTARAQTGGERVTPVRRLRSNQQAGAQVQPRRVVSASTSTRWPGWCSRRSRPRRADPQRVS